MSQALERAKVVMERVSEECSAEDRPFEIFSAAELAQIRALRYFPIPRVSKQRCEELGWELQIQSLVHLPNERISLDRETCELLCRTGAIGKVMHMFEQLTGQVPDEVRQHHRAWLLPAEDFLLVVENLCQGGDGNVKDLKPVDDDQLCFDASRVALSVMEDCAPVCLRVGVFTKPHGA